MAYPIAIINNESHIAITFHHVYGHNQHQQKKGNHVPTKHSSKFNPLAVITLKMQQPSSSLFSFHSLVIFRHFF